jgi:hypothetical protein
MVQLILKRASAARLSGEWNDDDFDVLADGTVVGIRQELATGMTDASRGSAVAPAASQVDSEHFRSASRTCRSLGGKLKVR